MTSLIRHPIRTAILIGIIVTIVFGLVSFPSEDTIDRTVEGWLPANHTNDPAVINDLISTLESERDQPTGSLVTLSEDDFRDRDLPVAHASIDDTGDNFVIRYLGKESGASETVYLAERKVSSAPWWSPDRLFYQAAEGKVDTVGDVLTLTYERDLTGLVGLLVLDMIVGAIYAAIAGLILWTLGLSHLEPPAGAGRDTEVPVGPSGPIPNPAGYAFKTAATLTHSRLPPESPISSLGKGQSIT